MIKSPIEISSAVVQSADPQKRSLVVNMSGTDRLITDVLMVNNPGNYSFPDIGDTVLVLTTPSRVYAVGVIQFDYDKKIERKKVKDLATKKYVRADPVDPGNISIGNIVNKTKFRIDKSGDFSFWSAAKAGFKFESTRKILSFSSNLLSLTSGTVISSIGSVFRQLPGTGNTPIQAIPPIDSTGIPGFSAVEVFFDLLYKQLRLVRLHMGHVLTSKGIPEFGTFLVPKPLRAILEVCFNGISISAIKMDEGGNIELSTTIGKIKIDSTIPVSSVLLGGDEVTAAYSVPLGELLLTWLNTHTHSSSWGPTGPAIVSATSALLSQKVKVGP